MSKEEFIQAIETMTVAELADLVKALEERFGVTAAAPVAVASAAGAAVAGEPEEEKTDFDLFLKSFGANKVAVIKVVRELTGLNLKDAKDAVEKAGSADAIIKQGMKKEEAEEAKKKLVEAGAEVELK